MKLAVLKVAAVAVLSILIVICILCMANVINTNNDQRIIAGLFGILILPYPLIFCILQWFNKKKSTRFPSDA